MVASTKCPASATCHLALIVGSAVVLCCATRSTQRDSSSLNCCAHEIETVNFAMFLRAPH